MIQMSALTLDWGNRAPIRRPWTVICSFHREQAGEGKKWQKHPSNGHFPDRNTWILLPSHKTTAPPNWRHSSELSGQGNPKCKAPAHQKPQVPRLPEAQRFPAQLERASKAKKHSPSTSPGRRQTQRGDLRRLEPLDKSVAKRGSPTDSAGPGLCPARVPLPGATSAATPLLPSCFTSLVPTCANSPPLRLPPASRQATHHQHVKARRPVRCHRLPLPSLFSFQLLLPSLALPTPN